MSVVATWKNSEFALPLCNTLAMHPVARPAVKEIDPLGCLCVQPVPKAIEYICGSPPSWRFEISGITDETCTGCGENNGTFILDSCILVGVYIWSQGTGADKFILRVSVGGIIGLEMTAAAVTCDVPPSEDVVLARWIGSTAAPKPDGSIVLSLGFDSGDCKNLPGSVLVVPAQTG